MLPCLPPREVTSCSQETPKTAPRHQKIIPRSPTYSKEHLKTCRRPSGPGIAGRASLSASPRGNTMFPRGREDCPKTPNRKNPTHPTNPTEGIKKREGIKKHQCRSQPATRTPNVLLVRTPYPTKGDHQSFGERPVLRSRRRRTRLSAAPCAATGSVL